MFEILTLVQTRKTRKRTQIVLLAPNTGTR